MAVDLQENVAGVFLNSGMTSHQALMADVQQNGATANNIARLSAVRKFDQMDIAESRANSGMIATPIASPTTQQPASAA